MLHGVIPHPFRFTSGVDEKNFFRGGGSTQPLPPLPRDGPHVPVSTCPHCSWHIPFILFFSKWFPFPHVSSSSFSNFVIKCQNSWEMIWYCIVVNCSALLGKYYKLFIVRILHSGKKSNKNVSVKRLLRGRKILWMVWWSKTTCFCSCGAHFFITNWQY